MAPLQLESRRIWRPPLLAYSGYTPLGDEWRWKENRCNKSCAGDLQSKAASYWWSQDDNVEQQDEGWQTWPNRSWQQSWKSEGRKEMEELLHQRDGGCLEAASRSAASPQHRWSAESQGPMAAFTDATDVTRAPEPPAAGIVRASTSNVPGDLKVDLFHSEHNLENFADSLQALAPRTSPCNAKTTMRSWRFQNTAPTCASNHPSSNTQVKSSGVYTAEHHNAGDDHENAEDPSHSGQVVRAVRRWVRPPLNQNLRQDVDDDANVHKTIHKKATEQLMTVYRGYSQGASWLQLSPPRVWRPPQSLKENSGLALSPTGFSKTRVNSCRDSSTPVPRRVWACPQKALALDQKQGLSGTVRSPSEAGPQGAHPLRQPVLLSQAHPEETSHAPQEGGTQRSSYRQTVETGILEGRRSKPNGDPVKRSQKDHVDSEGDGGLGTEEEAESIKKSKRRSRRSRFENQSGQMGQKPSFLTGPKERPVSQRSVQSSDGVPPTTTRDEDISDQVVDDISAAQPSLAKRESSIKNNRGSRKGMRVKWSKNLVGRTSTEDSLEQSSSSATHSVSSRGGAGSREAKSAASSSTATLVEHRQKGKKVVIRSEMKGHSITSQVSNSGVDSGTATEGESGEVFHRVARPGLKREGLKVRRRWRPKQGQAGSSPSQQSFSGIPQQGVFKNVADAHSTTDATTPDAYKAGPCDESWCSPKVQWMSDGHIFYEVEGDDQSTGWWSGSMERDSARWSPWYYTSWDEAGTVSSGFNWDSMQADGHEQDGYVQQQTVTQPMLGEAVLRTPTGPDEGFCEHDKPPVIDMLLASSFPERADEAIDMGDKKEFKCSSPVDDANPCKNRDADLPEGTKTQEETLPEEFHEQPAQIDQADPSTICGPEEAAAEQIVVGASKEDVVEQKNSVKGSELLEQEQLTSK